MKRLAIASAAALGLLLSVRFAAAQSPEPAPTPAPSSTMAPAAPAPTLTAAPIAPPSAPTLPPVPATAAGPAPPAPPLSQAKPDEIKPGPYPAYPVPLYGPAIWGAAAELPEELTFNPNVPIPRGYIYQERYNLGLLIAGPSLFLVAYGIPAISASEVPKDPTDTRPWNTLYVPIVGPFVFASEARSDAKFVYIFEGLAQLTGVALLTAGLVWPKELLVRARNYDQLQTSFRIGPGSVQMQLRF